VLVLYELGKLLRIYAAQVAEIDGILIQRFRHAIDGLMPVPAEGLVRRT
jgi:hypothetical protein